MTVGVPCWALGVAPVIVGPVRRRVGLGSRQSRIAVFSGRARVHLMKQAIRPASALGWWAFWLGIASVIWGVLLPSLPRLLRAAGGAAGWPIPVPVGLTSVTLEFSLAASALAAGIVALKKGERSWLTLVGFVAAFIVGGFWILFALGEVLSPH